MLSPSFLLSQNSSVDNLFFSNVFAPMTHSSLDGNTQSSLSSNFDAQCLQPSLNEFVDVSPKDLFLGLLPECALPHRIDVVPRAKSLSKSAY